MRDAIAYAEKSSYKNVIISDGFQRPYIFILFYTQYPPATYQKAPLIETQDSTAPTNYRLGKYYVTSITSPVTEKSLYILPIEELPELIKQGYQWQEIHQIKNPMGKPVIKLLEVS